MWPRLIGALALIVVAGIVAAQGGAGNVNSVPLDWAGKLFYSEPGGDYECSGQFIRPNVILTAAHCVRDPDSGDWYKNFEFQLQYNNGSYSHAYRPSCGATKQGWVQKSEDRYNYDYALLLTGESSATGHFGWSAQYDVSAFNPVIRIGYPIGLLSGKVIQVDVGQLSRQSAGILELRHGDPADQRGSSGGAWVGNYSGSSAGDTNRVISVNSFHQKPVRNVEYGPYFDNAFTDLLQYIQTNPCR